MVRFDGPPDDPEGKNNKRIMITTAHFTVTKTSIDEVVFDHVYVLENPFLVSGKFSQTKENRNNRRIRDIKDTLNKVYDENDHKLVCNFKTVHGPAEEKKV